MDVFRHCGFATCVQVRKARNLHVVVARLRMWSRQLILLFVGCARCEADALLQLCRGWWFESIVVLPCSDYSTDCYSLSKKMAAIVLPMIDEVDLFGCVWEETQEDLAGSLAP